MEEEKYTLICWVLTILLGFFRKGSLHLIHQDERNRLFGNQYEHCGYANAEDIGGKLQSSVDVGWTYVLRFQNCVPSG